MLKLLKEHVLPNLESDGAETGSQDGCHGGHLENLEVKLDGRHWGVMEIQNCLTLSVSISKMAAMTTILKLSKQHLYC